MSAAVIPKLKDLYGRFLDAYNVHIIVTPTTHLPAGPIEQVQPWVMYNGQLVDTFNAYGQTVFLGPPLGVPAISIPIGLSSDGLPLGIHFQARPGKPFMSVTVLHNRSYRTTKHWLVMKTTRGSIATGMCCWEQHGVQ